jgi:hypothetical protein
MHRIRLSTVLATLLLARGLAFAQAAPAPEPAPAPAPAPVAAPAPAPAPAPEPAPLAPEPIAPPSDSAADMHAEHAARHEGEATSAVEALPAEDSPAPSISGFIEASYHANFSDLDVDRAVPMRVYDPPGHSFTLHAAHLAISHSFVEGVSGTIELDAGRDAAANAGLVVYPWTNAPQYAIDVQEAYGTYTSGIFSLTAGKFVTYAGIEVIEGPLNPTISRGYLFGYAEAFTHTGVKAHFAPNDQWNIGIGIVNGWDQITDNNNMKTPILRIGFTPSESFFAALSGSFGSEQTNVTDEHRLSVDLTGCYTAGDFALWFQGNVGTEPLVGLDDPTTPESEAGEDATWFGFGLQPIYTQEAFSFGGRVEFFGDANGARTGLYNAKFLNISLTPGYELAQGFKLRGELRADFGLGDESKVFGPPPEDPGDEPSGVNFSAAASAEYVF